MTTTTVQVDTYIVPAIGTQRPERVTLAIIEQLYARLERDDVGARTRLKVHFVLHAAFEHALSRDVVFRNPLRRSPHRDTPPRQSSRSTSTRRSGSFVRSTATGSRRSICSRSSRA